MENKPLSERCPTCLADLRAAPIPNTDPPEYYSHLIGHEIPWLYDGVLFYECPFCYTRFHRFIPGSDLWRKADPYVRMLPDEEIIKIKAKRKRQRGTVQLDNGEVLYNVHNPNDCAGRPCAIHNPSNHPLKHSQRTFHDGVIFRVCSHNVEHPDPDSIAWLTLASDDLTVPAIASQHICCIARCCRER